MTFLTSDTALSYLCDFTAGNDDLSRTTFRNPKNKPSRSVPKTRVSEIEENAHTLSLSLTPRFLIAKARCVLRTKTGSALGRHVNGI